MRDKLKQFTWHIHILGVNDIDHVYKLDKEMLLDRGKVLQEYRVKVEEENHEFVMEIMDDIAYYHGMDNLILWQLALWRLQGVFEGMIILKYLGDFTLSEKLIGLKAKLDAIRGNKFSIETSDYDELLEWGKLRNAISHCPPETYGYVDLREEDVLEYMDLIKRIISKWDIELEARKSLPQS